MIHLFMSFWGPGTLEEVSEQIAAILPGLEKVDPNMAQYFCAIKATTASLVEEVADPCSLSETHWPGMHQVLEASRQQEDLLTMLVNTTCRLSLASST